MSVGSSHYRSVCGHHPLNQSASMAVQCTIPGPSWVLVSKLGSQREVLFVCAGASRGNDVVPDPLRASACCRYFSGGGGRRGDGGGRICTVSHMTSPGVPTGIIFNLSSRRRPSLQRESSVRFFLRVLDQCCISFPSMFFALLLLS